MATFAYDDPSHLVAAQMAQHLMWAGWLAFSELLDIRDMRALSAFDAAEVSGFMQDGPLIVTCRQIDDPTLRAVSETVVRQRIEDLRRVCELQSSPFAAEQRTFWLPSTAVTNALATAFVLCGLAQQGERMSERKFHELHRACGGNLVRVIDVELATEGAVQAYPHHKLFAKKRIGFDLFNAPTLMRAAVFGIVARLACRLGGSSLAHVQEQAAAHNITLT